MKLLVAAVLASSAFMAAAQMSTTDAFNAGKDFANGAKGTAAGSVNSSTGQSKLPYFSTSAPESQNYQSGKSPITGAGQNKMTNCATTTSPDGFKQQECDAVNFLAKNATSRPKYVIDKSRDPIITGSKNVIANPGSIPGANNQQCRVERVKTPATYLNETCTETQTLDSLNCKKILKVACDPLRDGCDQGGIVPNSWAGDMSTSFTPDGAGNYILQFGTIADNYWGGWGAVYDRTLNFEIKDVGLISKFALTRAAYDDWMMVQVNGVIVYVGPRGGDRLLMTQQCYSDWEGFEYCSPVVQYCATCFSGPELRTNWNFGLNIDIKPHLRNGANTIFVRTIVAGNGEGAIQLTTRQLCPRNCSDQWDNSRCVGLEQRAQ